LAQYNPGENISPTPNLACNANIKFLNPTFLISVEVSATITT